ncbi:MAG: K(+)-transporting ATPase subunit C [Tepidisphaeraceae bacterium]|jgi:K+-transporting ATPase ATPase C chain
MNQQPVKERGVVKEIAVQLGISIVATIATAILCCGIYPAIVWGLGELMFSNQANGSLVTDAGGKVVGSRLIGQSFTLPKYFHPRPSAAGNGYDPTQSGGTNLGPTSDKLINGVHGQSNPANNFDGVVDLVKAYRAENNLAGDAPVPADAVTRSASGCDPHISVANALLQAPRVAKARNLTVDQVNHLIELNTEGPDLGFLGEKGVNVLTLNLALDENK